MASYFLAPIGNDTPFILSTGVAASGYKLFTYTAGSTTKTNTYQDNAGNTLNANPILLNSSGYPASGGSVVEIWLISGTNYKFVLAPSTDTDPPSSPIWTRDNISGINDVVATASEWQAGPTPTFVSATSFTLVGDQTGTFQVGRRLKTTNTAGTIYSTIRTSAFTSLTTVTVVNDSGTLDSGLSAVSYALLSATNESIPPLGMIVPLTSVAGTNTVTASATYFSAPLVSGQHYSFIPANSNTGSTTLNINSLGAKNVFAGGVALVAGELWAGAPAIVQYDGTQFNLQTPFISNGTFTITATGFTTTVTGTATYSRVGNIVTLYVPQLTGTSNATTMTLTGLPNIIATAFSTHACGGFAYVDNGVQGTTPGYSSISTNVITLTKDWAGGGWTNSGTKTVTAGSQFTWNTTP